MKIILATLILFINITVFSQTSDKDEALKLGREGVKLVDEGKYDDGIILFKKAQKLDPDNIIYPYEIGYAYALQKKYTEAIEICEPLKNDKNVFDEVYRLLGNCYDFLGQPQKALDVYNEGLKKFPNSGKLYHEIGICYEGMDKYEEAIKSFETGVKNNPSFSSNYYELTKIFSGNTNTVWGIVYGELFLNIERASKRSYEISKLLYDTYLKSIKKDGDDIYRAGFYKVVEIGNDNKSYEFAFNYNFGMELSLKISSINELNIQSLAKVRETFIELWYQKEFDQKYPNILFDWQRKIINDGNFTSYNYWLFQEGNLDEVKKWGEANEDKYNKFVKWFVDNPMKLNSTNKFYRTQY